VTTARQTLDELVAELRAELKRQRAIEARNAAKALSRDTPPRSRFANAAHATKARARVARLENRLIDLDASIDPDEETA
jgi:hypothetical protein